MTIITGTQFRANQSKYIDMAHKGERVILSSKAGYAELKPVANDDNEIAASQKHVLLLTPTLGRKKTFNEEEYITLKSHEDVDRYFESM